MVIQRQDDKNKAHKGGILALYSPTFLSFRWLLCISNFLDNNGRHSFALRELSCLQWLNLAEILGVRRGGSRLGWGRRVGSTGRGIWRGDRPLPRKKRILRLKWRVLVNSEGIFGKIRWTVCISVHRSNVWGLIFAVPPVIYALGCLTVSKNYL